MTNAERLRNYFNQTWILGRKNDANHTNGVQLTIWKYHVNRAMGGAFA